MPVTVTPEHFVVVDFDAGAIAAVAAEMADRLGLGDRSIAIAVDETTLLNRVIVTAGDQIEIRAESGAFEDPKRPRSQSVAVTRFTVARALLVARDRLSGGFGEAPADAELTIAQRAAWQSYLAGRLSRLGVPVHEQRWRYDFRNRHGFSDLVDAAFRQVWEADDLDWPRLADISDRALGARGPD